MDVRPGSPKPPRSLGGALVKRTVEEYAARPYEGLPSAHLDLPRPLADDDEAKRLARGRRGHDDIARALAQRANSASRPLLITR